jgi:hypothetical protein
MFRRIAPMQLAAIQVQLKPKQFRTDANQQRQSEAEYQSTHLCESPVAIASSKLDTHTYLCDVNDPSQSTFQT